jgi:hypothetical protein
MKTIHHLIAWLRRRVFKPARRRDNQLPSAANFPMAGASSKAERPLIQQDDSPPGYKIRWHH